MIDNHTLVGLGIGHTDAHLLAATMLTAAARLWTRDRRLAAVAGQLELTRRTGQLPAHVLLVALPEATPGHEAAHLQADLARTGITPKPPPSPTGSSCCPAWHSPPSGLNGCGPSAQPESTPERPSRSR